MARVAGAAEFMGAGSAGALLSAALEMAQIFTPGRNCSAIDLLDNVIGSGIGLAAGIVFERMAGPAGIGRRRAIADRSALALLFCWGGALLFPIFPAISPTVLACEDPGCLQPSLCETSFHGSSAAGSWFVAGGG